jgi:hypothetical protein
MPSFTLNLTDTFQPLIDFKKFKVMYFNLEVENFDGPALEFTLGDPAAGAGVELLVPKQSVITRDNRPLCGLLYGKTIIGISAVKISIW